MSRYALQDICIKLKTDEYVLSLTRCGVGLAALCSDNSIRCIPVGVQPSHDSNEYHDTVNLPHVGGTTAVAALGPLSLVTTGYDGHVRAWDLRDNGRNALDMNSPISNAVLSSLACGAEGSYTIAAGSESDDSGEAPILIWDTRQPSKPRCTFTNFHSGTITQLAFHPRDSSCLLSASADGLVSLISTALPLEDEDDALLQVRNHRSPVQRAGFLAATPATAARDMEAWALSTDECLTIYNLAETDTSPDPSGVLTDFGDVRPSLGCAYVVGLFPKGDGAVILSGVTESNSLRSHYLSRQKLGPEWQLDCRPSETPLDFPMAHGDAIVRDAYSPDDFRTVYTCGEDGTVRLWARDDNSSIQPLPNESDVTMTDSGTTSSPGGAVSGNLKHGSTKWKGQEEQQHRSQKKDAIQSINRYTPY